MSRWGFLFPGQGAQAVGMGKDFFERFSVAREVFEKADDLLGRFLSRVIFEGPEDALIQTRNSQTGIFVTSLAILSVLQKEFPSLKPEICAGLSLGEYSALTAAGKMTFEKCLPLVEFRAEAMQEACEKTTGTMAALFGLSSQDVIKLVKEIALPNELWVANFNCPGQTVISGTVKGVTLAVEEAKARGAKRAIPLTVHGAFHSGLMQGAESKLKPVLEKIEILKSPVKLVMNVTGQVAQETEEIRANLMRQVTSSVQWEEGVRTMMGFVDRFVEIGCGKVLTGLNRQIGAQETVTINKVEDLDKLANLVG